MLTLTINQIYVSTCTKILFSLKCLHGIRKVIIEHIFLNMQLKMHGVFLLDTTLVTKKLLHPLRRVKGSKEKHKLH